MSPRWLKQIVLIQDKGYAAFREGKVEEDNPYKEGYRNQNGAGGQLQRQRREAWRRGFLLAKKEKEV